MMERSASVASVTPLGVGSTVGHQHASTVTWGAVIGGAFVAAALALVLLALGAGLGFSSVSAWSSAGSKAAAVGVTAIVWLIVAQIMASAMGGYVAGRLRTRWMDVHTDEVYFRDTAHGLLVWAVAAVVTAGLLTTAAASMAGDVARSEHPAPAGGMGMEMGDRPDGSGQNMGHVDALFRADRPAADRSDASIRAEAGRIFAADLTRGNLDPADKIYLGHLVSARTGMTESDAEQRVSQNFANAEQALDTARKSAAKLSLWIFVALLAGAFSASVAATIGGRQRDNVRAREIA